MEEMRGKGARYAFPGYLAAMRRMYQERTK